MSETPQNQDSTETVFRETSGDRGCIGMMLTHEENQQLLEEWLATDYDVLTQDGSPFSEVIETPDLLLLDAGAYEQYAEVITEFRDRGTSLFQPVLLLTFDDELRNRPEIQAEIDDVVSIPVDKAILRARIDGLLTRRELSRELAASETRFRTLFETGPDPSVVVDDTGTVRESNAAFCELLDKTPEECNGKPLSSFDAFPEAAVEKLCSPSEMDRETIAYRIGDGDQRYAECSSSSLTTDVDGDSDRAEPRVIILRDISEQVRYERELEQQINRLNEFGGVLAHEMRNPLNVASGWITEAEATGDASAFERVAEAHARMGEMIDALLRLARQGEHIEEKSPVALAPLITDSWNAMVTQESTLVVDEELNDYTVAGDRERLRDVFINLFRNAIEHGGPTVVIEVGLAEDGDGIYIRDDGLGFGDADRNQLFDPGYTTAGDGTGFGLAIVKQIVDAHGWEIRAVDGLDGGACFEISGIPISPDSREFES